MSTSHHGTMFRPHFRPSGPALVCALFILCLGGLSVSAADHSPAPAKSAENNWAEEEFHDPFAVEDEMGGRKVRDPLEPMNRVFFRFNDKLYFWILKPAARGYNKVAPEPCRAGVQRFFVNARYPIRAANNLLQAKFKGAGIETARFVVNSTVGLAGFFDPARSRLGLEPHPEDFDQTLGFYGCGQGIYLHWPFWGPSSVRGTAGLIGDYFLTPWPYLDGAAVTLGVRPYETLNATSLRLGEYEDFKESAFDPYVSLRSAYFDHRRSLLKK